MSRVARSLRDLVRRSEQRIEHILLPKSEDLVCRNMFCDKVSLPCLCRLEQAVCYADLSLVTRLDLSSNRLTELPPSLDKMVNLEYLDLSNNNLKVLPRSILTFDRLKEIRLNGNDFSSGDSADGPEQINGLRNYGDWLFRKDD